ncbi:DUF4214 domain-containing protein [Marinobacter sp. CA1]|uniref:DUF4214 domain-containing protein n=1 Tax=Marinobacter sp. CA1 TaxID=2817656 RepID=UPI001D08263B|nr:DUF4214 domain-containing protein [Marinobacter sp. CA1]UDL03833.1 DUF4214 domain-containing protein [Marinobacter sp. CA1]
MAFNSAELGVIRTYIAITGDAPTQSEFAAAFEENSGLPSLATELLEGRPQQSNQAFVEGLYQNLLGREADQEGLEYWASLLSASAGQLQLSKARLAVEFQNASALNAENEPGLVDGTPGLTSVDGVFDGPIVEPPPVLDFRFDFDTTKGASDVTGWTHTKSDETGEVSDETGADTYMSNTHKIYNVGMNAIDQGTASISRDYTFRTENQLGDHGHYEAYFLSPILDNVTTNLGTTLTIEVIDRMAEANNKDAALSLVAIQSFSFRLNGEEVVVGSDDILNATTYEELEAAIEARITELAEDNEALKNVSVDLGADFTRQQVDADTLETTGANVLGTQIVITATGANQIERGGFSFGERTGSDRNVDPSGRQDTNVLGSETDLVTTNLEFKNVGYGSQGGSVNVSGQSLSDRGVEQFDIKAEDHALGLGVWLTELSSQPLKNRALNTLEVINLTGAADYFHVGIEQTSAENVDGGSVRAGKEFAGITDVRVFNASQFAQNVRINAEVTDNVVARDLNLGDGQDNPAGDNQTFSYNLGNGDNQLFLSFSEQVIAHEDVALSITSGSGNDKIVLVLDNDDVAPGNWYSNQKDQKNIVINTGSGNDVVETQGAGDATILTGAGNDVVYTDNVGVQNFTLDVTTAAGLETAEFLGLDIPRDATGAPVGTVDGSSKAIWAFNSETQELGQLLGGTGSPLPGTTGESGPYFLYDTTLTVTLSGAALAAAMNITTGEALALENGFEATVDVPTGANYAATERHINQAIKTAINGDAVLSQLLEAIDGPNDTLIVRSKIDGAFADSDLRIDLNNPDSTPTGTEVSAINTAWQAFSGDSSAAFADGAAVLAEVDSQIDAILAVNGGVAPGYEGLSKGGTGAGNNNSDLADVGGNALAGADSGVESNNVIDLGVGNDVVVMGTGVDSNDTLVVTGSSIGHNTVVNFVDGAETGRDFVSFNSYLTGQIDVSANGTAGGASTADLGDAVAQANAIDADQVVILTFAEDATQNETWDALSGADLINALNGNANAWAALGGFAAVDANNTRTEVDAYANAQTAGATFIGNSMKNIVLVDSDHNRGEYRVYEVTTDVVTAGAATEDQFGSATLLGVIDFGHELDAATFTNNLVA